MGKLDGKVAIVTGAGSGIGKAAALLFAQEGARVACADISGAEDATAAEIGSNAIAVRTDVAKAADVRAMVGKTVAAFGRLDVAFNNAGIEGPQALTADYEEDDFDRVISINLKGVFLGMKYEIPAMLASGGGSIINTASVAGWSGSRTSSATVLRRARWSRCRKPRPSSTPPSESASTLSVPASS